MTVPDPSRASSSTAPPLLEVAGLRKDFLLSRGLLRSPRSLRAVDDVSLAVHEGETLGIVGESGSGKSTVGRMVLRLLEPTAGSVRFAGEDVLVARGASLQALRRRMQMVFQDPSGALNPHFTVYDAIAEGLRIHRLARGLADERERVIGLLRKVGIDEELATRFPRALSGGQRQRVVIARALAVEPRLVFCDEPVAALDVSVQAQVLNLLRDLQDDLGLSYLFVAHDLAVVTLMSHRVAVMYAGRIVETGAARLTHDRPLHPYTKALLASVPRVGEERAPHRLAVLTDPPDLTTRPPGCAFFARCPDAEPGLCDTRRPELRTIVVERAERAVACHRA